MREDLCCYVAGEVLSLFLDSGGRCTYVFAFVFSLKCSNFAVK